MGLLDIFSSKSDSAPSGGLTRLPSGSFTVDAKGQVLTSTLPQAFPAAQVREVAANVLETFRGAQKAGLPLSEIVMNFSALKVTARELRGGAIIFLAPHAFKRP